jgi:hypothetical protein
MSARHRRWCSGKKIKHTDPAAAEKHRAAIEVYNARRGEARLGRLSTYWCTVCGAWHVGHERIRADVPSGKEVKTPRTEL